MRRKSSPPERGDVVAEVGLWTILCNDPGYSMLVRYEDGRDHFLTHRSAVALAGAILEALRKDAPAPALEPHP